MIGWPRLGRLLAIFSAAVAFAFAAPAAPRQPASGAPDRQILVMVQHSPDHYRPNGSYGGGYGDELARSARQRLAKRIAAHYGLTLVDDWPMPLIGMDCFIMIVPDGHSIEAAVQQVSSDRNVAWAEPVQVYHAQQGPSSHNDPLFPAQPAAQQWRLADLHRLATGRGITVAVIDSRIDGRHPDLAGQVPINLNFVASRAASPELHGTEVAGIIAARADNGIGIAGVAPDARVMGLRACWQEGDAADARTLCDGLSLAKALYFAIEHKAAVINLSLSGPTDRLLEQLLNAGMSRGAVIVSAFDPGRADGGFPASLPGVIAVSDESLAASPRQVYSAPGRDVPTTQPGGRWYLVNGTSYAAAHVSGLVALVRERRASAAIASTLVSARSGGGAIDACATLVRLDPCNCACASSRTAAAGLPQ